MKLDARQVEGFLRDPGAAKVALLFGDDVGLIRERARALVRAIAGSSDDPFRVVDLDRDGIGAVPSEMASASLTGGRRVVRVRDVTDAAAALVQRVLDDKSEGFLVLEAPGLVARAKLRGIVEKAARGVTIGCYPLEGRALEQEIRAGLAASGVTAEADVLAWLAANLGVDQAVTRREIEKLALYVGDGNQVDLVAAQICVGDLAGLSLDDALFAATSGDVPATDRALELAIAEGMTPVGVLRVTLLHLQKLQRARAGMTSGQPASAAAKAVRPPIFFRREGAFVQALTLWREVALDQACTRVWEAERSCKRTGAPAETICRNAVIGIALRAAAAARR